MILKLPSDRNLKYVDKSRSAYNLDDHILDHQLHDHLDLYRGQNYIIVIVHYIII